jgi:hypothetical protein
MSSKVNTRRDHDHHKRYHWGSQWMKIVRRRHEIRPFITLQALEFDIAPYWPTMLGLFGQMCRPTYNNNYSVDKISDKTIKSLPTIFQISKRYVTLSVGFNVEITLQNRDKCSAPRPPPGALPLDPAGELPSQVFQAPGALLRSSKLNWLSVEDYLD